MQIAMQKVKMFSADNIIRLQCQINDFIEEGHVIEQISSSNHVNGYTTHYTCAVLYHDTKTSVCPTVGDIDVRR